MNRREETAKNHKYHDKLENPFVFQIDMVFYYYFIRWPSYVIPLYISLIYNLLGTFLRIHITWSIRVGFTDNFNMFLAIWELNICLS